MGNEESKRVLTEVIRRQMAILGPDITLAKVKNVAGIEVDASGNVLNVTGDTQMVLQSLINQFVELSGLIVKKTMESVIMSSVKGAEMAAQQMGSVPASQAPVQQPVVQSPAQTVPQQPQPQSAQAPAPEGYNIGAPQPSQPAQAGQDQVSKEKEELASANRELEDLNKMLNNLTVTQAPSGGVN